MSIFANHSPYIGMYIGMISEIPFKVFNALLDIRLSTLIE